MANQLCAFDSCHGCGMREGSRHPQVKSGGLQIGSGGKIHVKSWDVH